MHVIQVHLGANRKPSIDRLDHAMHDTLIDHDPGFHMWLGVHEWRTSLRPAIGLAVRVDTAPVLV